MMTTVMLMCNAEEVFIGITWLTIDNYYKQKQNQKDFKKSCFRILFHFKKSNLSYFSFIVMQLCKYQKGLQKLSVTNSLMMKIINEGY